ncbi:histidine ammonia-lyase [Planotetraspora thailandica]|uniref:Histidine ammonia-lyase n=1 Tax=Planotetraspora thailandica TaxID=487172 RepID=A0A8J3XYZ7_9ACTN|nr:aromatic amino acid ammonia-lyase [Planotetraspora thailandica]GII55518.1 histidine ammonia-lyase [Planotetraspora thailandica]
MSTAPSLRMPELSIERPLHVEDVESAKGPLQVLMHGDVLDPVRRCHEFVISQSTGETMIYGQTTGYGALVNYRGRADDTDRAEGLIDFLTVGQGDPLPAEVARGMLLVRLATLSRARSGVSAKVLQALAAVLATPLVPVVPRYGSVGASGDLAPLAHATRLLTGHGEAFVHGTRLPAGEALKGMGITPLTLTGRDALALVNGTSLSCAAAALAVAQAKRSLLVALHLTAALAEALGASPAFADDDLAAASGHAGVRAAAAELRDLLAGGVTVPDRPLQEVYSIRCAPQLVGAAWSALEWAGQTVEAELNGVSDNPLFFPEQSKVAHGGNFFSQSIAFAADLVANVLTQLANLAERQLDLLVDPHRNGGLPPLLAADPGRQHGLTGVQIAATSVVAAMRRECLPAGMQSLPTNLHNQDVVPFGNQAALSALEQAERLRWMHGMLAVALRQAFHLLDRTPQASGASSLVAALAPSIAPLTEDRPLDEDVRTAADAMDSLVADRAAGLVIPRLKTAPSHREEQ